MTSATHPQVESSRAAARVAAALRTESGLARLALGVAALHVVDDNFLQPQPGTSAGDHLAGGLVQAGLFVLFAWAYPRLRPGLRGDARDLRRALHRRDGRRRGRLLHARERPVRRRLHRAPGHPGRLPPRRHRPRDALEVEEGRQRGPPVPAAGPPDGRLPARRVHGRLPGLGVVRRHPRGARLRADPGARRAYEDVSFTTSDGLRLEGWYVPTKNGATVSSSPAARGRRSPPGCSPSTATASSSSTGAGRARARATRTDSAGRARATCRPRSRSSASRPEVDDGRIGGLGLSVGGEVLLQTAAETDDLQAVVSEGAGIRSVREAVELPGLDSWITTGVIGLSTAATAAFTSDLPPRSLKDLSAEITVPVFFIHATPGQGGENLTRPTTRRRTSPRRSGRPKAATWAPSAPSRRSTSGGWSPSSTTPCWAADDPDDSRPASDTRSGAGCRGNAAATT